MNEKVISIEDALLAALQSPEPEVRRTATRELGAQTTSDEREVRALMDIMENDDEDRVREMAYWALNSPANLNILHRHPRWEARVNPARPEARTKPAWWRDFGVGAAAMFALGVAGLVGLSTTENLRFWYLFPLIWLGTAVFSLARRRYGILVGMLTYYFANLLVNLGWLTIAGSYYCTAGYADICLYASLLGCPVLFVDLLM